LFNKECLKFLGQMNHIKLQWLHKRKENNADSQKLVRCGKKFKAIPVTGRGGP
jgi:hypothetical protein